MLWSWNKYHLLKQLNCLMFCFKIWLFHLKACILIFLSYIVISNCLAIISKQSSFQEVSNHLAMYQSLFRFIRLEDFCRIKLCIRFLTYSNHSKKLSLWWFFYHISQDSLFTLFIHNSLNSSYLYFELACFSKRILFILMIHRFILLQSFVCKFTNQSCQLNKDCSVSNLLNSKFASKVYLDLYRLNRFIDMIWIVIVLNTSFLIQIKLFLFCCFLHNSFLFFFDFFIFDKDPVIAVIVQKIVSKIRFKFEDFSFLDDDSIHKFIFKNCFQFLIHLWIVYEINLTKNIILQMFFAEFYWLRNSCIDSKSDSFS